MEGKKPVFCVFDNAACCTQSVFAAWTRRDAERGFAQAVAGSVMKEFPKDYELRQVGWMQPSTGELFPCDVVRLVNGAGDRLEEL